MTLALLLLLALAGCARGSGPAPVARAHAGVPVVLVSLDGFRWDYLDRGLTPVLAGLARSGVRARALVPVFPTKTFPNHYSIVTGLIPARHGIVGNRFTAPDLGLFFSLDEPAAKGDARFWGGEPIWVSAERQGLRTAAYFWPGSSAPIGGVRPTWWLPYDWSHPDTARVRRVLEWLALPPPRRPALVALYLSLVDDAGHDFGPDAAETDSAIARADRVIGLLAEGLERLGGANLVVVSDHGMAATAPERTIWLDDYVPRAWLRVDEPSPVLTAWPAPGRADTIVRALRLAPSLEVYRRSELPPRYELSGSPRVAPIVAVADEGWSIRWRPEPGVPPVAERGNHGYDDALASMAGIFVAHGPAFRRGIVVPAFRNVHVHPLLAELLDITVPAGDGSRDSITALLVAADAGGGDRR